MSVADGVVMLDGDVPSLTHRRLAGVLAWWVPGSRDIVNGLGVTPPEEERDEEITDAVRVALEKDPFVNASQIRVTTENCIVTLEGVVPKEAEREVAEFDAWYVFGVDPGGSDLATGGLRVPAPAAGSIANACLHSHRWVPQHGRAPTRKGGSGMGSLR